MYCQSTCWHSLTYNKYFFHEMLFINMCLSLNAVFQLGFCDIMEPHVRKRWRYTVPQVRLWQTVCVCVYLWKRTLRLAVPTKLNDQKVCFSLEFIGFFKKLRCLSSMKPKNLTTLAWNKAELHVRRHHEATCT